MVQFNNCEVYSDNGVFEENEVLSSCLDNSDNLNSDGCFTPDDSLLEIRINTENDIEVFSGQPFMVSGDCNEASFSSTHISWTAFKNSTVVSQSPIEYTCTNGRFLLDAKVVGTAGEEFKIEVDIKARDNKGQVHRNPFDSAGKSSIFVHIAQ